MGGGTSKSKSERTIGRELNDRWNVGAQQARYRKNGTWFHVLDRFPGALFDENGYILFQTQEDYESCQFLQKGKELGVPHGIASIPGYVRVVHDTRSASEANFPSLEAIISELTRHAIGHPIADLQTIRADIKGRQKRGPGGRIFGPTRQDSTGEYAFHYGGGLEFQFNIGLEFETREFRYGIAFSFEPSRSKPWPELRAALLPKVKLFNEFMELNAESFRDMRMWHYEDDKGASSHELPGPIPWERVGKGVFVFLGKQQDLQALDYQAVIADLDRLLPLYKYVESGGTTQPTSLPSTEPFVFRPSSWVEKASSTVATPTQAQLDVALRHNEMQRALYHHLISEYGQNDVSFENPSGVGTRVDIVVRRENEYWFYEIKTAQSPRACLREAIGQLLEYAFWPGAPQVTRIIVVGECPIDHDGEEYLRRLRDRFSLPIYYQNLAIERIPDGPAPGE
jgi:hypothetical protein